MLGTDTFALKIEFLLHDLLSTPKLTPKKPKNEIRRSTIISPAVRNAMHALQKSNTVEEVVKDRVLLEEDSQSRIKGLLERAKAGSFGADEQPNSGSNKKAKKLEHVSKELFDTEKRYLETLRILKVTIHKALYIF